MLFNYRYVSHSIERFQGWLNHLVREVWCQATGDFSLDLLHPDLRVVVQDIFNDEAIKKDHLYGPIKEIYTLFKTKLTAEQRRQVSVWFDNNNDIEALCRCDASKLAVTYAEIKKIDSDLEKSLKEFCKSLFTDVIHLSAVRSRIGDIDAHYNAFGIENEEEICPYCGYGDIKGRHHTKREAYDHFFPKDIYPFNTVNFRNLAPMCHECNSSYKLAKDPTRHLDPIRHKTAGTRRKAFYSYATVDPDISIVMKLKMKNIGGLDPDDIDLQITSAGRDEEVESWMDVFGIEERYKAKCLAKNHGRAWLQHIVEESASGGLTSEQLLQQVLRAANRSPWDNANFLKKPFLLACQGAGLI